MHGEANLSYFKGPFVNYVLMHLGVNRYIKVTQSQKQTMVSSILPKRSTLSGRDFWSYVRSKKSQTGINSHYLLRNPPNISFCRFVKESDLDKSLHYVKSYWSTLYWIGKLTSTPSNNRYLEKKYAIGSIHIWRQNPQRSEGHFWVIFKNHFKIKCL